MSETKHTPGPWQSVQSSDGRTNGYIRRVGAKPGEDSVARVIQGRGYSEQYANARLIAAAPELLESLEYILDGYWAHWMAMRADVEGNATSAALFEKEPCVIEARKAIAKAKGVTLGGKAEGGSK